MQSKWTTAPLLCEKRGKQKKLGMKYRKVFGSKAEGATSSQGRFEVMRGFNKEVCERYDLFYHRQWNPPPPLRILGRLGIM